MRPLVLALAGSLLSTPALAADYGLWEEESSWNSDLLLAMNTSPKEKAVLKSADETKTWSGDLAFGFVMTEGNTNDKTLKFHSDIQRNRGNWHYDFVTDATNTKSEGTRTAERYYMSQRGAYDFSEDNYIFAFMSYEDDRFSGFEYKATVALGYGRRLINRDDMKWDIEGGPGYRQTEVTDGLPGEATNNTEDTKEAIFRLASEFQWALSNSATFQQEVSVDGGNENTVSRWVTSLKSQVVGNIALKLSYTATYTEEVPAGREHADQETAITLVYGF